MKNSVIAIILYATTAALIFVFSAGSAAAVVTFHPHLSTQTVYTDNVDLTPFDEEHDFITTISPGMDLHMQERLSEATLSYTPSYSIYSRFSDYDSMRHDASLTAMREIARNTRLEFSNNYLYTEDPVQGPLYGLEDPAADIDTTVRRGRESYEKNRAELSLINQFGTEDTIEIGYEYFTMDNDDESVEDRDYHRPSMIITYWPLPERLGTETEISYTSCDFDDSGDFYASDDYDEIYARFRLTRRFGPHLDIYAEYGHDVTDYDEEGEGASEDYQVYTPALGFVWESSPNSSVSGNFGYFFQDNDEGENESGPKGTLEASYSWSQYQTFSLIGTAGYDQTDEEAENLGFREYYSLAGILDYRLSQSLVGNFSVGYYNNTYTSREPEREDDLWRASAGLAYQMLSWMVVELDYTFRDLSSDFDLNEYTENRAMLKFTFAPRTPLLLKR
ncbi:MAG: outer membrane beta-barrel protein [Desulfosalsimonadaceae bacterium]